MDYKKEIIKILEDEAVLLDEGYGTTGITEDEHEKIAERIVKLFAIPDVSNSVCTCESLNYGYGFAKCYDCGKIKDIKQTDL